MERHAFYTVHAERCYLNGCPLDLKTMEIDHIIPQELLENRDKLLKVLQDFDLPLDFNLGSYANLLPSCRPCNGKKSNWVFRPTPLIQLYLEIAAEKAPRIEELVAKTISEKEVAEVLNDLDRMSEGGKVGEDILSHIEAFVVYHRNVRQPEMVGKPIILAPEFGVLSENRGITIFRGPYGVGGGPTGPNISAHMRCGSCGSSYFSGARCVMCGAMDDD
jgi:hypothetical protein